MAEQAHEAVKHAAGKLARRGSGQGFRPDQEVRAAVEAFVMNMATEFYSKTWDVDDVPSTEE